MQTDFAKVITDQPRGGSDRRNIKTRMRLRSWDPESDEYSGPLRISGKESNFDRKSSGNARQNPLVRFLHSQIGQPWNRIWSDARHLYDARSRTQSLLLKLLRRLVELNCFVGEDGAVYQGKLFDGRHLKVDGFYVHPATGMLEWAESGWKSHDREPIEHPVALIVPNISTAYRRTQGIWYVQTYTAYDQEMIVHHRFDEFLGQVVPVRHRELKDASRVYLVREKQASRKELVEIKKCLTDAPDLIKKRAWWKVTIGYAPNLRTALLAKDAQAVDILKLSQKELRTAWQRKYDREQRRLEKAALTT